MYEMSRAAITVVASIITLAIIAVLVSKNAQTSQVLQAGGSALSGLINAAVSPVSGSNFGTAGNTGTGALN
jgi:hypothetical protein